MSKGTRTPWPGVGDPVVEVTQTYQFSAAHRLHNPHFSLTENERIYGRCNNPNGHGHTYRLEVTIRGPVLPRTGRIEDGGVLDEVVRTQILQRFDRMNLDLLLSTEDGPTSTTEVLAGVLWRLLDAALPVGRLRHVRLEETPNNFFDLDRDGVDRSAPAPPSRPRRTGARKRAQHD